MSFRDTLGLRRRAVPPVWFAVDAIARERSASNLGRHQSRQSELRGNAVTAARDKDLAAITAENATWAANGAACSLFGRNSHRQKCQKRQKPPFWGYWGSWAFLAR